MAFADLVNSDDLYYFRYDYPFNMHLSLISDACIFLGNSLDPLAKSLTVEFEQAEMKLSIEEVENGLSLKLLASSQKYEYALFNDTYKMLSLKPMWILADSVILPVQETAASISQVLEEPQIFCAK